MMAVQAACNNNQLNGGIDADLLKTLEQQLEPGDFQALRLIQQQLQKNNLNLNSSQSRKHLLQAIHAIETGQAVIA